MDNAGAFKVRLMKKIKYDKDIHGNYSDYELLIDDLIDNSKHIALSLKYPFLEDYTNVELPNKYINWQYRCCLELYKGAGREGIVSYAENGWNWSRLSDGLPVSLTNEIIPEVGVPKLKGSE